MQKVFLIITLLLVIRGKSQGLSDTVISVLAKEKYISHVMSNPLIKGRILASPYNADTLDFGVVVYKQIFSSIERSPGAFTKWDKIYNVEAYTNHDSIFLKRVDKIDRQTGAKTPLLFLIDTTILLEFINKHNLKYNSDWTLSDFLNSSPKYGSYSFLCGGMLPKITKQAYSLVKLVVDTDTSLLKNMASSFSAEDRAYGSSGLAFIRFKGIPISKELSDLISINQESRIEVYYCEGCISGTMPLNIALENSRLRSVFDYLISVNLL
jgi:hypothetical protein